MRKAALWIKKNGRYFNIFIVSYTRLPTLLSESLEKPLQFKSLKALARFLKREHYNFEERLLYPEAFFPDAIVAINGTLGSHSSCMGSQLLIKPEGEKLVVDAITQDQDHLKLTSSDLKELEFSNVLEFGKYLEKHHRELQMAMQVPEAFEVSEEDVLKARGV